VEHALPFDKEGLVFTVDFNVVALRQMLKSFIFDLGAC
jgi:hypothetical protein